MKKSKSLRPSFCVSTWASSVTIILLKKRVAAAAAAAHIQIAWQPFRAPELMPCEDLWRLARRVAANRPYRESKLLLIW